MCSSLKATTQTLVATKLTSKTMKKKIGDSLTLDMFRTQEFILTVKKKSLIKGIKKSFMEAVATLYDTTIFKFVFGILGTKLIFGPLMGLNQAKKGKSTIIP